MRTARTNLTGASPATRPVRRTWRVAADRRPLVERAEWWLRLCAAVAAWPGPPLTLERRLTSPARHGLVNEHLIAAVETLDVGAGKQLGAELEALVVPEGAAMFVETAPRVLAPWELATAAIHELRRARPSATRANVAPGALREALRSLPSDGRRCSVSLLVGSPPTLREGGEAAVNEPGPTVRFRLRLVTESSPPLVTLALLGAVAGIDGDEWLAARDRRSQALAAHLHACTSAAAWTPDGSIAPADDEPLVAAHLAADLASTPLER